MITRPRILAPLVSAMRYVMRYPSVAYAINQVLLRVPFVHQRLFRLAQNSGVDTNFARRAFLEEIYRPGNAVWGDLTRSGRVIASDLMAAVESRGNGSDA